MADRTSARIFGSIFEFLAETPDARSKEFAALMWALTEEFDFSYYQMNADDALIALGLACVGKDEDDEGTILYAGDDGGPEIPAVGRRRW